MSKTIIVSNRLPISLRHRNGRFEFKPSAGGLATGLGSIYKSGENIWIGWPGNTVEDSDQRSEIILELNDLKMAPVFLTKDDVEQFYEGFSNETLWPAFHYFTQYLVYNPDHWDAYVRLKGEFERLGVTKNTKVVSIPDDSFNISLFLMDRKGWTNFIGIDGEEKMNKVLTNGAAFMVIADETWLEKDFMQPYLREPLGTFEHLHLFKLSPQP
jgi:hypothetical protein